MTSKMKTDKDTYAVSSHDVKLDNDYAQWLIDIKTRYRKSQIKAAVKVNSEKLLFNWQLGRDLAVRKAEERWGNGIVEQVALDLQREFPGDGFSASNVWYMKRWYLFYATKLQQHVGQIGNAKLEQVVQEIQRNNNQRVAKLEQVAQEIHEDGVQGLAFPPIFSFVPWGHHVEILKKCKDIDEALFYIRRTVDEGWSRNYLLERIKADDYHNQAPALNNFPDQLPLPQAELAEEITKENYDFGFLSLPKGYNEKQLEDALCSQLTDFLLELGTGFAFVGRQKEIVVAGRTRRIDLLFYHIRLRAYVVCELKARAFEPEFAGKINYYVNAVDELLKAPDDNPTIGLLICSDMVDTDVKWSFKGITTPLGVAAYKNIQEIQKQLPTVEQLQERIKLLEAELREGKKP